MMGFAILFYFLAAIAVISAVGVISFRNPVYSALSLVVTLFALAALYVLLHAEFLAIIQIFTYAGAIMVLFIFIIMLLNLQEDELKEREMSAPGKVFLGAVSLGVFASFGFLFHFLPTMTPEIPEGFGSVEKVGKVLFTDYVIPFEIAGILLTVALIGAVLLAKRKL